MNVTTPPRISAPTVDPRAVISKKRSSRFTSRTLGCRAPIRSGLAIALTQTLRRKVRVTGYVVSD